MFYYPPQACLNPGWLNMISLIVLSLESRNMNLAITFMYGLRKSADVKYGQPLCLKHSSACKDSNLRARLLKISC